MDWVTLNVRADEEENGRGISDAEDLELLIKLHLLYYRENIRT